MAEVEHQYRQQQAFDQGFDDQHGQAKIAGAGGRNHGQADHHKGRQQWIAAAQAVAKGQKQAQANQQHAGGGVVTQQRDQ